MIFPIKKWHILPSGYVGSHALGTQAAGQRHIRKYSFPSHALRGQAHSPASLLWVSLRDFLCLIAQCGRDRVRF